MFKEEFYLAIRNDFSAHTSKSFLYQYFKQEKEDNIRLNLKRNYVERKDTSEDRQKYTRLVIEGLLENSKLQKNYSGLKGVFEKLDIFVEKVPEKGTDTDKLKNALKKKLAEILNGNQESIPSLSVLHCITIEILNQIGVTSQRKDAYVQLMEAYWDYAAGNISQNIYLAEILDIICNNSKIRLSEKNTNEILGLGKKLGGEEVYKNIRKNQEKFIELAQMLRSDTVKDKKNNLMSEDKLESIKEEILDCVLKIDVKTFLYDIGYSERTGDGATGESRKKDRSMDMLSQYCEKHNISFSMQNGYGSESEKRLEDPQYIKECKELFTQLNSDKITRVFIPLEIDSLSGAGVYIIGKDYFRETPERQAEMNGSCSYCYLTFEEVIIDENGLINFSMEEMPVYDNTLEGVTACYKKHIKDRSVLAGYQNINEDIPKQYKGFFDVYFNPEQWESEIQSVTEDIRQSLIKEEIVDQQRREYMERNYAYMGRRR